MPRMKKCNGRPVRWACISEIDARTHVGTKAWYARNSPNARRLSAWRRMHAVANASHLPVSAFGRSVGRKPSSNLTTPQMVAAIRRRERSGSFKKK